MTKPFSMPPVKKEDMRLVEVEVLQDYKGNIHGSQFMRMIRKGERIMLPFAQARRMSRRTKWDKPFVRILAEGEKYSYPGKQEQKFKMPEDKKAEPVIEDTKEGRFCKSCGKKLWGRQKDYCKDCRLELADNAEKELEEDADYK